MPSVIRAAKKGDAAIIKEIIKILNKEGIKVISSIYYNPELSLKAGNYTKPGMRKTVCERIKAQAAHGTGAGKWSARKAQALAKAYKKAGGGYK